MFGFAGHLAGKRVLDVGTGDGTYAIEAAARGADVVGLDASAGNLAAAKSRASARGLAIALGEGRAEALPFGARTFDVVLAVTVLCFVPEPERALAEMSRVLTPGGRLVLGELGRRSVWAAARRVRGWLGSPLWREARFRSRRELVALATGAGFDVERVRGCVFYPPAGLAARMGAPLDRLLGRIGAPGAAFIAVTALKS